MIKKILTLDELKNLQNNPSNICIKIEEFLKDFNEFNKNQKMANSSTFDLEKFYFECKNYYKNFQRKELIVYELKEKSKDKNKTFLPYLDYVELSKKYFTKNDFEILESNKHIKSRIYLKTINFNSGIF